MADRQTSCVGRTMIVKVTESILASVRLFNTSSSKTDLARRYNDVGCTSRRFSAVFSKTSMSPARPYGLKYSSHLPGREEPRESSSDAVKESIKRLIGIESGKVRTPISSSLNCSLSAWVEISRRTVTTYRDELGILPLNSVSRGVNHSVFHKLGGEQPDSLSFTITLEGSESLTDSFKHR